MTGATTMGVTITEFWQLLPKEYKACINGFVAREERENLKMARMAINNRMAFWKKGNLYISDMIPTSGKTETVATSKEQKIHISDEDMKPKILDLTGQDWRKLEGPAFWKEYDKRMKSGEIKPIEVDPLKYRNL